MAIGWLSVLKWVPWTEVVKNAPAVADGARKLWTAVAKKPPMAEPAGDAPPTSVPSNDSRTLAQVQERLGMLETASAAHQEQMLDAIELIKTLAEQNTQLVKRVEVNRLRLLWLAGGTAVMGGVALAGLVLALMGRTG